MNFATAMKSQSDRKLTENGAMAYNTLNDSLLDLFATIGALRPRTEEEIVSKFFAAFNEDALLATKMLFYAGNIRGGLGERRTFRVCLKWLAQNYPDIVIKNLELIPHFNRWDSLFVLTDTKAEPFMWELVRQTLMNDVVNMKAEKSISLLAKWMPSENTSSQRTRALARRAAEKLGFSARVYRKILSALRAYIKVVERDMSAGNWNRIVYEGVPSYAMKNYKDAFKRHDMERFNSYIAKLNKGEAKINASTLFPYDLVSEVWRRAHNPIIEAQWKALPNYLEGENNIVVMADVSGSMYGRPLYTSIGLAIYFAERNKGVYHGQYMTFTDRPHFISINDNDSLFTKVRQVEDTDIGYSTNLNAAFDYIRTTAIASGVRPDEMPKALVVVSDMEIDRYMRPGANWDFIETQRFKFAAAGYELPKIILWNVEARQDTYLSQNPDVIYVSGQSPSVFKSFINALNGETAYDVMLKTLNDKMYDSVRI